MATNQKQEVELLIKAGTEGLRSIAQLVKELDALGEDTGEASEQLQGLAGSLAELKNQQALVKQFTDLKSQTRQLADEQAEAKERATALGKALAATEQPTKAQRREFEQAKKASKAAGEAWLANQQQLNRLRGTLDEAGISTKDLGGEQVRIRKEIAGVNGEAEALAGKLKEVKTASESAASGMSQSADSAKDLAKEASGTATRLAAFDGALQDIEASAGDLKSLSGLVQEVDGLGVDSGDAARKIEGMATTLESLKGQQQLVTQFSALKAETRQLAEQQAQAKSQATALGKALAATELPTKAQREEFERARDAAKSADEAWLSNQKRLNDLRGALKNAGVSTKDLSSEQTRIRQELAQVNTRASQLATGLSKVRDQAEAAADRSERLAVASEKARKTLGKIGGVVKTVATGLAGLTAAAGASIAGLTLFSRRQADIAEELTNTSKAIGVNREQLQLWRIAGERVGISGEQMSNMLRDVSERLGELSRTGGGEAADVFETLNLNIRDFRDLRPDEQMRRLAQAIGEVGSQSEQIALLEMLASDASQLQPLLENNAAGLRAIFEEAQREGAIYSEAELDKLNQASDIYNKIDLKLKGLLNRIGAELAPAVAEATDKVLELFGTRGEGDKLIEVFKRLVQQSGDFVKNLAENGPEIVDRFRTITTGIQLMGSVAATVFNGLMTALSTFMTMLSGSLSIIPTLAQGVASAIESVGLISEESYGKVAELAERARQKTKELAAQTANYARATVSSGKGVTGAFAEIETSVESAGQQLRETEEQAEKTGDAIGTIKPLPYDLEESADGASEATKELRGELQGLQQDQQELQEEQSGVGSELKDGFNEAGDSIKTAGDETEKVKEKTEDAAKAAEEARKKFLAAWGAAFGKALTDAREKVTALSSAARNLFEMKIGGNAFVSESESAAEALERASKRTDELAAARRRLMSNSFSAWFADTALAAAEVEEKFWAQAVAMENLQEKIEAGSYSLEDLNYASETAASKFDLLDDQRLNGLQGAIDAAKRKLESLSDSADSTLNSLRQRLADIRGDTEEAQRLQFEAERERLQEQLEEARQAGANAAAADYQEALDTLEKINAIEQKNRREEDNARERAAADRQREQERAARERREEQRQINQPVTSATRQVETVRTINVNLNGETFRLLEDDEDAFVRALERARGTFQ
ncbi:hypothetical protein [Marinobacter xestospongiae]|uniref:hypothetical protein n=1 Tax=Marinobacter xestospongiae TaxID=994319 RepID=UPI0020054474|nr:hypothetical protein [Marinobacter xestospongiae]MCK7568814.1 hypothetical protein [Marinobacter xestospongiae]